MNSTEPVSSNGVISTFEVSLERYFEPKILITDIEPKAEKSACETLGTVAANDRIGFPRI